MTIDPKYFFIVNIIIILIYGIYIIKGYKNGFLYEILSFLCLLLALVCAYIFAPILAGSITLIKFDNPAVSAINFINIQTIINVGLWFVILTIASLLILFIIRKIVKKASKIPVLGFFNRILGSLFGIINATIVVLVLSLLLNLSIFKNGQEIKQKTFISYTADVSDRAFKFVLENVDFSSLKNKIEDFEIDKAKEEFIYWIDSQRDSYE